MKKIGFATLVSSGLAAAILGLAAPAVNPSLPAMGNPSWIQWPKPKPASTIWTGSMTSARR